MGCYLDVDQAQKQWDKKLLKSKKGVQLVSISINLSYQFSILV